MRSDHLDPLGYAQSLGVAGHDECGNPLGARRLARAGEDDIEVCDATIGDPGLFAGKHIVAAVTDSSHLHVSDIGPGARLRQRKGGNRLAGSCLLQPALLVRRAEQRDRAGAKTLHGEGEVGEAIMAGQRLARDAERAHVQRRGIGRVERRRLQPAVTAELRHQRATGGVDIVVVDGEVFRAPGVEGFGELAVAVFEERPGEEGAVRHGENLLRSVPSHPPLSCRTSPPQGGRLAASVSSPILQLR
ncbi:conserved hypothetical protein [Mesorhizobium sp. SOD10]|nr:conserved hypothetical protein [Mesorhizobium sp. SOD10]